VHIGKKFPKLSKFTDFLTKLSVNLPKMVNLPIFTEFYGRKFLNVYSQFTNFQIFG